HEMGIRMALGARRGDVLGLVLRQGMAVALIGVALGLSGAFAMTRALSGLLFSVKATDPITFFGISLLLALVALAATYFPARRAPATPAGVRIVVSLLPGGSLRSPPASFCPAGAGYVTDL